MNSQVKKKCKITNQKPEKLVVANKIADTIGLENYKTVFEALCSISDTEQKSKAICAFFANSGIYPGQKCMENIDVRNCRTLINQPLKNESADIQEITMPAIKPIKKWDPVGKSCLMFADSNVNCSDGSSVMQMPIKYTKDTVQNKFAKFKTGNSNSLISSNIISQSDEKIISRPSKSLIRNRIKTKNSLLSGKFLKIQNNFKVSKNCHQAKKYLTKAVNHVWLKNIHQSNVSRVGHISQNKICAIDKISKVEKSIFDEYTTYMETSKLSETVLSNGMTDYNRINGCVNGEMPKAKEFTESEIIRENIKGMQDTIYGKNLKSHLKNIDSSILLLLSEKCNLIDSLKNFKLSLMPYDLPIQYTNEPFGWFVDPKLDKVLRLSIKPVNIRKTSVKIVKQLSEV